MSMNETTAAFRTHIAFFGCRNAGKSSLVNAVTGQDLTVVSDVAGTTTDPVSKAMELLPLGPVQITDTAGYDDVGKLGSLRTAMTDRVLRKTDLAVLVINGAEGESDCDRTLIARFAALDIPYIAVWNKCDLRMPPEGSDALPVSALRGIGIHELKERIAAMGKKGEDRPFVRDLLRTGDDVLLVTPIDGSAPKGRIILPQQQILRDALDAGAVCHVTKETELERALELLRAKPKLVITDSQVFSYVAKRLPADVPLTSFSILMIRSKGLLAHVLRGAKALDRLKEGDRVLISEGCTHHRQCGDIGTVKLPAWIEKHVSAKLCFEFTSGGDFPEDVSAYSMVIHCGGCMLNDREMRWRANRCVEQNVPMTNYGIAIAHMNGILERSVAMLPEAEML